MDFLSAQELADLRAIEQDQSISTIVDKSKALERLRENRADFLRLLSNGELEHFDAGMWVAVTRRRVVASASSMLKLVEELRKQGLFSATEQTFIRQVGIPVPVRAMGGHNSAVSSLIQQKLVALHF